MTVRTRLTPQTLLSAPRRSPALPNPSGTLVLHTATTYSFSTHSKTTELRLLSPSNNESTLLSTSSSLSSPVWLDDTTFLLLSSSEGKTDILASPALDFSARYTVGSIPSSADNLKITRLDNGGIGVVVSALQDDQGELWEGKKRETYSSGKLYKSLYARHWDTWEGQGKNALWYAVAARESGKWGLRTEWRNLLKGRKGLESPVRPFGGTDSFDVSRSGIVFVSKDPERNPALNTTCGVYLAGLSSFEEEPGEVEIERVDDLPGQEGAAGSPVFTPDGDGVAFLKMRINGYESDRNQIWVMLDVHTGKKGVRAAMEMEAVKGWDKSPSSLVWSLDGQTLYLVAEEAGYNKLFSLSLTGSASPYPKTLTEKGSVSSAVPLTDGSVFLSSTSLIDNSLYSIVKPTEVNSVASLVWSHSISKSGSAFGLSESQVSSIWTPAANPDINEKVHSWVVRPSNYDKSKKYPLAFLIHGGPQGAWTDAWSTRWNSAVFAEQGYIVVSPNPTGSTGYGQAFTDAIRKQWGGDPYRDLENVFEYIEKELSDVDTSNAVALGASYGGYMINWINGHPLGRKFKALVNHDGIFSVNAGLATDELYFPFYDLGGLPFYSPSSSGADISAQETETKRTFGTTDLQTWIANDPAQHLDKWETPQLVIHSSKDYRLCISEGLSAFNVLQARGIESQFLTFPDENHWVLKPENSLVWHKVVFNWINKFTGLPQLADEGAEGADFYGGVVQKEGQREGEQDVIAFGNPTT